MKGAELNIKLLRIEEDKSRTHFYRWEMVRYSATPVDVNLTSQFSYRASHQVVRLTLGAHYTTMRDMMCHRLMDYTVAADFELLGPEAEADAEELVVSVDLVKMMLGVAIGAMRGMISLRTSHTFLSNYPLPIYNLDSLMEPVLNAARDIPADVAATAD